MYRQGSQHSQKCTLLSQRMKRSHANSFYLYWHPHRRYRTRCRGKKWICTSRTCRGVSAPTLYPSRSGRTVHFTKFFTFQSESNCEKVRTHVIVAPASHYKSDQLHTELMVLRVFVALSEIEHPMTGRGVLVRGSFRKWDVWRVPRRSNIQERGCYASYQQPPLVWTLSCLCRRILKVYCAAERYSDGHD